jgi:hypothetical protein
LQWRSWWSWWCRSVQSCCLAIGGSSELLGHACLATDGTERSKASMSSVQFSSVYQGLARTSAVHRPPDAGIIWPGPTQIHPPPTPKTFPPASPNLRWHYTSSLQTLNIVITLCETWCNMSGANVFSIEGKGLKLTTAQDIEPHIQGLKSNDQVEEVKLLGNTLGVEASEALAKVLETKKNLKACWSLRTTLLATRNTRLT